MHTHECVWENCAQHPKLWEGRQKLIQNLQLHISHQMKPYSNASESHLLYGIWGIRVIWVD